MPGVVAVGYPKPQIAALGIFRSDVVRTACVMSLSVEVGAVFEAVLHGAAQDGFGVDAAIGLGDDATVEGAGFVPGGGAVIFDGIAHEGDLRLGEPPAQRRIGLK